MRSGRLRHSILIEEQVNGQDPQTGAVQKSWQTYKDLVAARYEPLSGKELIAAQANRSEVTTRFVVRYDAGITAKMRIVYRGKIFNIHAVLPDPKSGLEYLTLPCTDGLNDGR